MKIYIIPTGWDRELAIKAAFKSGADKICLISTYQKKNHLYSDMDKLTKKISLEIYEELIKFTKVDLLEVDYFDTKHVVSQISKYMKENEGAEFVINIATSSRLVAVALSMIAYMKNIKLEFSRAKYNQKIVDLVEAGENIHVGFDGITEVVTFPLSVKLSVKEKSFLSKVRANGKISVKEFVGGVKGNNENRLRSEFHYICRKLERQGLVEIKSKGRVVEVELTQFGAIFAGDI